MGWLGARACPSHRHGHFVIFVQTFLLVEAHFGVITIQLEGWEGEKVRDLSGPSEAHLELGASLGKPCAIPPAEDWTR